MTMMKNLLLATAFVLPLTLPAHAEKTLEGIHVWTSESEVKSLKVLTAKLLTLGYTWQDSAVGGANGANAVQALRTRVAAGNPPATMQFIGFEGLDWAGEDALRSLNELYAANGWDKVLPPAVLQFVKSGDNFISVPVDMHRQNWVWANKAVFDKAGITVPASWDELIADGDKLKAAGVTPLAMGNENWQIMEVFEAIMGDVNGPDFYRKAVVELDDASISSPEMLKAFDTLRKVRGLVDKDFPGRDWSAATAMVANGQAGMQVMGDWAKGEFLAKGMKPGVDFLCFPTPTATPNYKFVIDTFGMFKIDNPETVAGQDAWANSIMDPATQKQFNLYKGSIPARTDIAMDEFDDCAKASFKDRAAAIASGTMYGSLTDGFATQTQFSGVYIDVVGKFFNSDMTSADAVKQLADGIANAR